MADFNKGREWMMSTKPDTSEAVELKPCPFCGLTATEMQTPDAKRWWVECDGCGVSTPTDNFGDPVRCWNTRSTSPSPAVEALVEALNDMVNMVQYAVDAGMNGSISATCPTMNKAREALSAYEGKGK